MEKTIVTIIGWGQIGFSLAYLLGRAVDPGVVKVKYFNTNESTQSLLIEHGIISKDAPFDSKPLPSNVEIIDTIEQSTSGSDIYFLTTPPQYNEIIVRNINESLVDNQENELIVVGTVPYLDPTTGKRASEVYAEALEGRSYHYVFMPLVDQPDAIMQSEKTKILLSSFNEGALLRISELISDEMIEVEYNLTDLEKLEHTSGYGAVLSLYTGLISGCMKSNSTISGMVTTFAQSIKNYWQEQGMNPDLLSLGNKVWASSDWIQPTRQEANYIIGAMTSGGSTIDDSVEHIRAVGLNPTSLWQLEALSRQDQLRSTVHDIDILIKLFIDRSIDYDDAIAQLKSF